MVYHLCMNYSKTLDLSEIKMDKPSKVTNHLCAIDLKAKLLIASMDEESIPKTVTCSHLY